MTKEVKGTKYRKVKQRSGRGRYSGRVHLVFWFKEDRYWKFVCGKQQSEALGWDLNAYDVPDNAVVTCTHCIKFAPDVVEKMKAVETKNVDDLEELDYGD
jgi:hypothetical protein